MIVLEILLLMIGHDRRGERTKPFAMLDAGIEHIFHVWQARMRNDRAIAQSARSPFHASLKPANNISGGNLFCHLIQ